MKEEEKKEKEKTASPDVITIRKDSLWKYSTFILVAILIVGAFVLFMEKNNSVAPTGQVINEPEQGASPSPVIDKVNVDTEGYPSKGKADAPVVIVEYSDYQCPYCGRFFSETSPQIEKNYIDTGKASIVFKDFPLNFHQFAEKAAEAAHCVREQKGDEGYWLMHDKLFANQESLSIENFQKWARELGANGAKFDDCLGSGKMAPIVQKSFGEGQKDGVRGTPSFFINGKILSGALPFSDFKQAIDAELQ